MDNVVQNIRMEDIIPSNFKTNVDPKKIEELAVSIKNYGILEPLLVRPQNGKYEIILGNKRYQAAKMIGLNTVPALVRNVDDEVLNQYRMINQMQQSFSDSHPSENKEETRKINTNQKTNSNIQMMYPDNRNKIPLEEKNSNYNDQTSQSILKNINNNINSDIVNLAELNKKEERDDLIMNNNQFNNMMNNNVGGMPTTNNVQEPTFGGRFFPSLEDEPTNMNMGGMNIAQTQPQMPNIPQTSNEGTTPNMNNNLIDLTDIASEKEPISPNPTPTFMNQPMPSQPQEIVQNNQTINPEPMINQFNIPQENEISNQMVNPIENNTVNLDSLQTNNQPNFSNPYPTPGMSPEQINNAMPDLAQDFQNISQPTQNIPQFDMSQNIAPANFNQPPVLNEAVNIPQNNYPEQPAMSIASDFTNPTINNEIPNVSNFNPEVSQMASIPNEEIQQFPQKEVLPVVNTIKSIATSLEAFGYKINMIDEDGATSYKITIEIEK